MSSLSKVILVLGKARRHRVPTLGCREAESPGWFDALQKNCTRHDVWMVTLSWWRWQSLVAHSHGLLNHPNSFYRVIFALKLNAKFDAYPLLYSVILNVTATQYTCSLYSIYCPHWLVLWSCHCSCMRIPLHFPWLLGYVKAVQTILVILTIGGLFTDRPHYITHTGP